MADTNYNRGEMDVEDHQETFGGFMTMSVYGGVSIIVTLLFPILIFGVGLSWPVSLLLTVVLGIILGVIMKFAARYYAILVAVAIALAIILGLVSLLF